MLVAYRPLRLTKAPPIRKVPLDWQTARALKALFGCVPVPAVVAPAVKAASIVPSGLKRVMWFSVVGVAEPAAWIVLKAPAA